MAIPSAVLDKPIDWHDTGFWPMLEDLQGNILKGHGRDHTLNHFLSFDTGKLDRVRAQIRALGSWTTSALRQLGEAEAFHAIKRPGGTNVFFFLTASGYAKLGKAPPEGEAFAAGMASRDLADPASAEWEVHLRPGIDALLIVADDDVTTVGNAAAILTRGLEANGIDIVGIDAGHALRSDPSPHDAKGRGIEHFGYVDGRSQPLMLTDDVDRETTQQDGIDQWNPSFGPGQAALVRDPNGTSSDSYGSFFIYRKLEQNVKGFKAHEKALAAALAAAVPGEFTGDDDERAGAMVVGRFEDGTPLALSRVATDPTPTPNNFNYKADPKGLKCPINGHVRKVNPRQDSAEQRSHLMPRRGIPFGDPDRDLEDEASFPTHGVGLLFMAYNQSLERQFEVTQRFWANSFDFPGTAHGADAIIGQGAQPDPVWTPRYGTAGDETAFGFNGFVTMKGGEYFFAPSRGFLKTL